jgi:uncharacterized protein (DUF58 family)
VRSARRTALLGAGLLLIGGLFDGEPLYAAGLAFLVLGLGAIAWVWATASGVSVEREVAEPTVVEDEPLDVRVVVRGRGLPLPGGVLDEALLERPLRLRAGHREMRIHIQARFARRGRRTLPPPRVVLRDPLGLAERVVAGGEEASVLVLPRTSAVRTPSGWGAAMSGRARSALTVAAESEVDGLRPYQVGSPASRIHWPALARGHGMLERRLRAEIDARPLIVLDTRGPASPEAVDAAVRAAASLVLHLARAGGSAVLLPGERRPVAVERDLAAWPGVHVRLALVEAGHAPGPAGTRTGPVLYVAARVPATGLTSAPRSLREVSGPRLLVVPAHLPGVPASLQVAGCRGYPLGRAVRGAA